MVELTFSMGIESFTVDIPKKNILANIVPRPLQPVDNLKSTVNQAIENPIGGERLAKIARPDSSVAICVNSGRGRVPLDIFLPVIIDHLTKAGVKEENVKIVVGQGVHRGTRLPPKNRLVERFGKRIADDFEIIFHCGRPEAEAKGDAGGALTFMGITSRGVPILLNSEVAKCDVKIAVGAIEYNANTGYRGGGKMIVPGVAGWDTICANHRLGFGKNWTGYISPSRLDGEEAARMVGLNFCVDCVRNPQNGDIVSVTAGDQVKQHREGVKVLRHLREVPLEEQADILIASTHMGNVRFLEAAVKKGGTILLVQSRDKEHPMVHRECPYWKLCEKEWSLEKFSWPVEKLIADAYQAGGSGVGSPGWNSHIIFLINRILTQKNITLVSKHGDHEVWEGSGFGYAYSLNDALDNAFKEYGSDAKIIINNHCFALPLQQWIALRASPFAHWQIK
jgi:nickel-dependent lactate racemase